MIRLLLITLTLSFSTPVLAMDPHCEDGLKSKPGITHRVIEVIRNMFWPKKAVIAVNESEETAPVPAPPIPQPQPPEPPPDFRMDIVSIVSEPDQAPPKAGDTYDAHNKGVDQPPGEAEAKVLSILSTSAQYYMIKNYMEVDASTGRFGVGRFMPLVPSQSKDLIVMTVLTENLHPLGEELAVPFGYYPRKKVRGDLNLFTDRGTVRYQKTSDQIAEFELAPVNPVTLDYTELMELTKVQNQPMIADFPEPMQTKIYELIQRQTQGASNIELAKDMAKWIRKNFKYEVDQGQEHSATDFCQKGSMQCDGASLVLLTVLRAYLNIPSYAVAGFVSVADAKFPTQTVIHDQLTPHMYSAVYNEATRLFEVVDPTPSEVTREKENPGKEDPRFTEWPNEDSADEVGDSDQSEETEASGDAKDSEGGEETKEDSEDDSEDPLFDGFSGDEQDGKPGKGPIKGGGPPNKGKETPRQPTAEDLDPVLKKSWNKLLTNRSRNELSQDLNQIQSILDVHSRKVALREDQKAMQVDIKGALEVLVQVRVGSLDELISTLTSNLKQIDQKTEDERQKAVLLSHVMAKLAPGIAGFSNKPVEGRVIGRAAKAFLANLVQQMKKVPTIQDRLPGEISRTALASGRYHSSLFDEIAAVNDMIKLRRAKTTKPLPNFKIKAVDHKTDYDDKDYAFAEDFEHYEHFVRDGYPSSLDAARVLAGDMRYTQHFEEEPAKATKHRPLNTGKREITYLLLDASISMNEMNKGVIRDVIAQTWIDELMSNPHSEVHIIVYDERVRDAVSLTRPDQAAVMFERMLQTRPYFKHIPGNDTTAAFRRAQLMISALPKDIKKVNVRLITDGEEHYDMKVFRDIRDNIGKTVELNLTAVTLISGNKNLENFVKEASNKNIVNEALYMQLSFDEIHRLLMPVKTVGPKAWQDYKALPYADKAKIRDFTGSLLKF